MSLLYAIHYEQSIHIYLLNWCKKVVDLAIEVTDGLKIVPHCAISKYINSFTESLAKF